MSWSTWTVSQKHRRDVTVRRDSRDDFIGITQEKDDGFVTVFLEVEHIPDIVTALESLGGYAR